MLSTTLSFGSYLEFTGFSAADPGGYKNVSVNNLGSSAASPFANGDAVVLYLHADDRCWEAALVLCEGGAQANKTGLAC